MLQPVINSRENIVLVGDEKLMHWHVQEHIKGEGPLCHGPPFWLGLLEKKNKTNGA